MKSIAIKTNNSQTIEYIQNNIKKISPNDIYVSKKKFKHFTNLIIHYKGNKTDSFLEEMSTILSFLVIYEFEENIFKHIIFSNYFYFFHIKRLLNRLCS